MTGLSVPENDRAAANEHNRRRIGMEGCELRSRYGSRVEHVEEAGACESGSTAFLRLCGSALDVRARRVGDRDFGLRDIERGEMTAPSAVAVRRARLSARLAEPLANRVGDLCRSVLLNVVLRARQLDEHVIGERGAHSAKH